MFRVLPILLWLTACPEKECPVSVQVGVGGASPTVVVNPFAAQTGALRLLGATPLALHAEGRRDREVTIAIDGEGLELLDEVGAPARGPFSTAALPAALYLSGTLAGEVSFHVSVEGCEDQVFVVRVVPNPRLAGRVLAGDPAFHHEDAFPDAASLAVALDATTRPDLVAVSADAYVVSHHDAAAWSGDTRLEDLTERVETISWEENPGAVEVWSDTDVPAGLLGQRVDVVLDVDRDGTFSPGDVLDAGADGEGLLVATDFGSAGPHPVDRVDVSGGDWLGERVYWPTDLAGLGPRPLVVISHGNGHDYTWYDYLGEHLASWGYVVMAHQNETGPGIETASGTTLANTDWFLGHLEEVGGGVLVGLVDTTRIAWIGHSRGGEGVVRAYTRVREGEFEPVNWTADAVAVIASIAPTVFYEVNVSNPFDVRYHVLSGSSDGDVTGGPESPFTQWWRLSEAGVGVTSTTYIYGASHEDFDCCGGDDGTGPDQLGRQDVQDIARAYLLAVVAEAVDGDPFARALLDHDPAQLPATFFTTQVVSTWNEPDGLVIDDFQSNTDPGRASSGAPMAWSVAEVTEGRLNDADTRLEWTGDDPMNGMTQADLPTDLAAGLVFEWGEPGYLEYELPAEVRDWTGRRHLSMRVCQGTRHPLTVDWDAPLGVDVTLVDGAGVAVTRTSAGIGLVPPPYLRSRLGDGEGWSNAFTTLRFPLVDFAEGQSGLDFSDIRYLRIEVGGPASPMGRFGLDDVEVTW